MAQFNEDTHINATLSMDAVVLPDGCVTDDEVAAGAEIASSKLIHRNKSVYSDTSSTTAAAQTRCMVGMWNDGYLHAFEVGVHTLMSAQMGDNRTVTFDLQTANGTSVLVSPVTIDKTKAAKTLYPATIQSPNLSDGDTLWLVVTVGGSEGIQASGLFAVVTYDEDPT